MRKESEIRERLESVKKDLAHASTWYSKAYEKYQVNETYLEEIKVWAKDTNQEEVNAASNAVTNCANEIRLLEWVLADTKPEIPVTLNRDEGDE